MFIQVTNSGKTECFINVKHVVSVKQSAKNRCIIYMVDGSIFYCAGTASEFSNRLNTIASF